MKSIEAEPDALLTEEAVRGLAALAHPSRLGLFRLLVGAGPAGLAAGVIADELAVPPATLSFHLKELAHAGLVTSRRDGRRILYSADYGRMSALVGYLTENCCERGDAGCCAPGSRPDDDPQKPIP